MSQPQFIDALGWLFEHSSWVAERAWKQRPFESFEALLAAMNSVLGDATEAEELTLLRAHPDLGTRAKVSASSTAEQAGAGLDQLTPREYASLLELNAAYKEKFGFPFLYAVKGSDKFAILKALETRLQSTRDAEFEEALRQVQRIARFRLEGVVTS